MTDTVRTLDDLLALFADNSSANISAQDLRDATVTLFGGSTDTELLTYASSAQSVAENAIEPVEFDFFLRDPQGWAGSGSQASDYIFSSPTFPEGSWFELPQGTYQWFSRAFWASKPGAGYGAIELLPIIQAEVDADDVWSTWGNGPNYNQKNVAFAQRRGPTEEAGGVFRIALDSMKMGIICEQIGTGVGPLDLEGAALHISRI